MVMMMMYDNIAILQPPKTCSQKYTMQIPRSPGFVPIHPSPHRHRMRRKSHPSICAPPPKYPSCLECRRVRECVRELVKLLESLIQRKMQQMEGKCQGDDADGAKLSFPNMDG